MSEIRGRLIKGSIWIGASRALVNALAALSTIVLARLLMPEDFGLVALATTMLMIVNAATELSLASALVQHASPSRSHIDTAWTLSALRSLAIGGVFAAAGGPAADIYGDPRLAAVMVVLGIGIGLTGLTNPKVALLQRDLIFWQDFALSVAQKLVGVLASITWAMAYKSYWALVVGTIAMQVTSLVLSYLFVPYRPRISFSGGKELFRFSGWLTAGQIVNTLNWRFDFLLVGKGLGTSALGHYSVGNNLAQLATREVTAPLTKVLFPGFSSIREDRSRLATAYQRAQGLVTAFALPAGIGAALVADPLVRLTMGDKWAPAIFIVQALASIFAVQTLASLSQPIGMALGETRLLFIRSTQMLAIRVPLIVVGMLAGGLTGIVLARVVSGLIAIYFNLRLVRRFTGLGLLEQLAANWRALVSSCAMVGIALLIDPYLTTGDAWSLAFKIATIGMASLATYLVTMILLWLASGKPSGPEREFQELLRKLLKRKAA
ncbi:lipopolysaccharide biosynthesis protein [uncultured Ramlibacter sp.]|uniref:lipopolysaccharide biosynthesis protein n=1 Tax=uncultured Ramlibacter sp. TaxID=260755 RepID=UPI00260EA1CC|nr:lipopolysaccharide biosynthesis protein [uncultured Ramlibacter sp.]